MAEDEGHVTVRVAQVVHDLEAEKSYVRLAWRKMIDDFICPSCTAPICEGSTPQQRTLFASTNGTYELVEDRPFGNGVVSLRYTVRG